MVMKKSSRTATKKPKTPTKTKVRSAAVKKTTTLKKGTKPVKRVPAKATPKRKTCRSKIILDDADVWSGSKQMVKKVRVGGVSYDIPVDEGGYVPEYALAIRFAQVCQGDRNGAKRSLSRDLDKTAERSLKLGSKIRPEDVARWWAHPNESDIVGIDNETTQIYGTEGATRKSSLKYQKKIGIVGTPAERRLVRKTLDDTFTTSELKKITDSGSTYIFGYEGRMDLTRGRNGYYRPSNGMIAIKKGSMPGTIVHETNHKLRHVDRKRTGTFTSSKIDEAVKAADSHDAKLADYLVSVEEATNECETVARLTPFKINGSRTSYYGYIAKDHSPGDAKRMMSEDRKMLVGNADPEKTGLKGRRAVASVEKNFTKMNISGYGRGGKTARDYTKAKNM